MIKKTLRERLREKYDFPEVEHNIESSQLDPKIEEELVEKERKKIVEKFRKIAGYPEGTKFRIVQKEEDCFQLMPFKEQELPKTIVRGKQMARLYKDLKESSNKRD